MRGGCLLEVVAHGGSTVLHLIIANCASLVMSPTQCSKLSMESSEGR